ncbi:putative PB1 domain-containing protein [Helianthus annuus]|nr:putative PB1 domain-containing protein [Helianthus annuus]
MLSLIRKMVRVLACSGGWWEEERNGDIVYTTTDGILVRRALELPVNGLKYSDLKTLVARKLKLSMQSEFTMSYQYPSSPSSNRNKATVVGIEDDEDVEAFIDLADEVSPEPITLYVED